MKLKHLFLSTLVACAFASCSDDDGPGEPVYQQIDSYLSISATSNNKSLTKASTVEEGDPKTEPGAKSERAISKLTAIVFYDNGDADYTYAAHKVENSPVQDENGYTSIEKIPVKVAATEAGAISTTKLKVVILANVDVPQEAMKTYNTLASSSFSGIINYSFEEVMKNQDSGDGNKQYIPMSSSLLDVEGVVAGSDFNNWVEASDVSFSVTRTTNDGKVLNGSPSEGGVYNKDTDATITNYSPTAEKRIPLVRYVARVQLEHLTADFGENYDKAKFTLTQVSLANVSNYSLFAGSSLQPEDLATSYSNKADGGQVFYRGYPETIDRADYYLARSVQSDALTKNYGTITGNTVSDGLLLNDGNELTFKDRTVKTKSKNEMAQFYAFEFKSLDVTPDEGKQLEGASSPNINTMLIITGLWENGPVKEVRSFRIPVRHENGADGLGVKRNYIYKIYATLTGEGTNNPDKSMLNAYVSFTIKVEDWDVIKQSETDVN